MRNVTRWQPDSLVHTTSLDNLDFKFETSLDLSVIDLFRAEFDWVQLPKFVSWILEAVNLNPLGPLGITEAPIYAKQKFPKPLDS